MKKIFLILAFLSYGVAFANPFENPFSEFLIETKSPNQPTEKSCKHSPMLQERKSILVKRNYDVLSYDLTFDMTKIFAGAEDSISSNEYSGRNRVKIRIDSNNVKFIEFDAVTMTNLKVFLLNENLNSSYNQNILKVELDKIYNKDDELVLDIFYDNTITSKGGLYLFPKNYTSQGQSGNIVNPEKLLYSQSEAEDARLWWPCNDKPYDKALISCEVLVQEEFTVSSNGTLNSKEINDGIATYNFSTATPMTTYLYCLNISKFAYKTRTIPLLSGKEIPWNYYIWESDWDSSGNSLKLDADYAFRHDSMTMAVCEKLLGEYPYESYGVTAVYPYMFGGMEHQTLTTIHRNWLRGNSTIGLIHELAHQWLGDKITLATWNDIWINEGGASWMEAFLYNQVYGDEGYNAWMDYHKQIYIWSGLYSTPIYFIPEGKWMGSHSSIAYSKASWVYNMLYQWTNKDFKNSLQAILQKYAFTSIETIDIINTLKEMNFVFPIDIDTFFEQWIFSAGHPEYSLVGEYKKINDTEYEVQLGINQIQSMSESPEVFDVMQKVIISNESELDTFLIRNNSKNQIEKFVVGFEPTRLVFDNVYTLSMSDTVLLTPVSIKEQSTKFDLFVAPNIIEKGQTISINFEIPISDFTNIKLFAINGKEIQNISKEFLSKGIHTLSIPSNSLSSGIYFISLTSGGATETCKFIVE